MFLINSHRYSSGGGNIVYLYDNVSVMYTLRRPNMTNLWTNAVLAIRRSSDNEENWVWFDSNGKISLNSKVSDNINTPSTNSLGSWVGSDEAYVKEWIGLTPNNIIDTNKIAEQTTITKQPKFINSGVILTKNGEPTIDFLNNDRFLDAPANTDLDSGNDFTILSVTANQNTNTNQIFLCTTNITTTGIRMFSDRRTVKAISVVSASVLNPLLTYINQEDTSNQKLLTLTVNSGTEKAYYNNALQDTDIFSGSYNNDILRIGANQSQGNSINEFQEIAIFPSDKTSDLTALNTDINDYYSIYNQLIADYPLENNSNEVIGTTSGIDGVDTSMSYDGTEATFNVTTSYISIPDNDIFSFTDGNGNDKPFTIEFVFNVSSIITQQGIFIINKRGAMGSYEWHIAYFQGAYQVALLSSYTTQVNRIKIDVTKALPFNTDIKIKVTYNGSKLASGIKLFVDDILQSGSNAEDGTYVGMSNTNDTVLIGKAGWEDARYLDGTMKTLNFTITKN